MNLIENIEILESEKKIVGDQCYQNYSTKNNYTDNNLKNEFLEKIKTMKEKQVDEANNAYALGIAIVSAFAITKWLNGDHLFLMISFTCVYLGISMLSLFLVNQFKRKIESMRNKLNLNICKNEKTKELLKTNNLNKNQEDGLRKKINKILKEENIDKNYDELKKEIYLSSNEKTFNGNVINEIIDATINALRHKAKI